VDETVRIEAGADDAAAIVRALVQADIAVHAVFAQERSLEDAFFALTDGNVVEVAS
jgi:hypothetical protein